MKIAVIGAGNVGTTLGRAWLKRGHEVSFGVRDPAAEKARELARQTPGARVLTISEAARNSDFIVLATPWPGTAEAVRACGDLQGKVVIDCTNPLREDLTGLEIGLTTSAGEQVAEWAKGAQVFKTMNQVGYRLMDAPQFRGLVKPVMFVCGDGERKPEVKGLVDQLGFEVIDAGGIQAARLLEQLAMLWIHLALNRKVEGAFAFALLRQ